MQGITAVRCLQEKRADPKTRPILVTMTRAKHSPNWLTLIRRNRPVLVKVVRGLLGETPSPIPTRWRCAEARAGVLGRRLFGDRFDLSSCANRGDAGTLLCRPCATRGGCEWKICRPAAACGKPCCLVCASNNDARKHGAVHGAYEFLNDTCKAPLCADRGCSELESTRCCDH